MADFTDVLKKMKADLPGEINGVKEYATLSKMADESDEDCWAKMLKDMAWEEHTHAKHIMHILDKNNVSYAELVPAYNEAQKMLMNL
jgi:rubrerythrin